MGILDRLKFLDAQVEQSREPDIEDDESMRVFREAAEEISRLRAELEAAKAEAEALRVDAERYRWIKIYSVYDTIWRNWTLPFIGRMTSDFDAAIDAARGKDNE